MPLLKLFIPYVICVAATTLIANHKGMSGLGWFVAALLFPWLVIVVPFFPNERRRERRRLAKEEAERQAASEKAAFDATRRQQERQTRHDALLARYAALDRASLEKARERLTAEQEAASEAAERARQESAEETARLEARNIQWWQDPEHYHPLGTARDECNARYVALREEREVVEEALAGKAAANSVSIFVTQTGSWKHALELALRLSVAGNEGTLPGRLIKHIRFSDDGPAAASFEGYGIEAPAERKLTVSASDVQKALEAKGLTGSVTYAPDADWIVWVRFTFVPPRADTPIFGDSGWVRTTSSALVS